MHPSVVQNISVVCGSGMIFFLFLPCKCVRLLFMTRYKLFRGIFFVKKEFKYF